MRRLRQGNGTPHRVPRPWSVRPLAHPPSEVAPCGLISPSTVLHGHHRQPTTRARDARPRGRRGRPRARAEPPRLGRRVQADHRGVQGRRPAGLGRRADVLRAALALPGGRRHGRAARDLRPVPADDRLDGRDPHRRRGGAGHRGQHPRPRRRRRPRHRGRRRPAGPRAGRGRSGRRRATSAPSGARRTPSTRSTRVVPTGSCARSRSR